MPAPERPRRRESSAPSRGPSDFDDLTPELQERLVRLLPHLVDLGMGCVHSAEREDDGIRESEVDCSRRVPLCRAVCCSFRFALTPDEADGGKVSWDQGSPFFIARGEDGYCVHHDRGTGRCLIWEERPLRCRRYDCRRESSLWSEEEGLVLLGGVFDHLP